MRAWRLRTGVDVEVSPRGAPWSPAFDIELCFPADRSHLALARSVAAEVVQRAAAECAGVERARLAVGTLVSALLPLADPTASLRCHFAVSQQRLLVRVSVPGQRFPSPEAKGEHARLLEQLVVVVSMSRVDGRDGAFDVVSETLMTLSG